MNNEKTKKKLTQVKKIDKKGKHCTWSVTLFRHFISESKLLWGNQLLPRWNSENIKNLFQIRY